MLISNSAELSLSGSMTSMMLTMMETSIGFGSFQSLMYFGVMRTFNAQLIIFRYLTVQKTWKMAITMQEWVRMEKTHAVTTKLKELTLVLEVLLLMYKLIANLAVVLNNLFMEKFSNIYNIDDFTLFFKIFKFVKIYLF